MRPGTSLESLEHPSRKRSVADPAAPPADRRHASPTIFFLAREHEIVQSPESAAAHYTDDESPVRSSQAAVDDGDRSGTYAGSRARSEEERSSSRRRSTIKATSMERLRRTSSAQQGEGLHLRDESSDPALSPSRDDSIPSSPKSMSSRSLQKSDEESANGDTSSQAIASSEDEGGETSVTIPDSTPQLIMPSIKMPSRRPFTARGKQLGRFKILVAGSKGSGKTSLIKSIVQLCEDLVHVDPLASQPNARLPVKNPTTEIYASTKPYPSWWSDIEESRILKRRKSMGDSVLERNICFVDTGDAMKLDSIIHYLDQQLCNSMAAASQGTGDLAGLLSGRGGSHVDVVLYLVTKDTARDDEIRLRRLSELSNVIPVVAKADLLSTEEIAELKGTFDSTAVTLPDLSKAACTETDGGRVQAPYSVSSANGPDFDNMDASLLMSPEYVQPLVPSELGMLIDHLFEADTIAYLRHTAAKKIVDWHAKHPRLSRVSSPSLPSAHQSTLNSPIPTSLSNSGVLVPLGSELSLNTSNSFALAKVADHSHREERLAQVRLSKWATDLQISLQRERERFERIARGERAMWLVERMGEEIRGGQVLPMDNTQALVPTGNKFSSFHLEAPSYAVHDPLGFLRWQDTMRTRGWIALQIVGSFGVMGGLALWMAKAWGFGLTSSLHEWAQSWGGTWSGMNE